MTFMKKRTLVKVAALAALVAFGSARAGGKYVLISHAPDSNVPSVAHGMAIEPTVDGAIKDVVSQFWSDDKISVAEAQKRILAAAKTK